MLLKIMCSPLSQAIAARELETCALTKENLEEIMGKPGANPEEILNFALMLLEKGDFQERWHIAKLLPKLGESAIAPLIEILGDENADLDQRWFAGKILGQFNQPQVIVSLINLLKTNSEPDLTAIAAESLANLGTVSIEVLSQLLRVEATRQVATEVLARIPCPEVIEPLLTMVEDGDAHIRATVIEALSSFHEPRILPVLIKALQDHASKVRKEAVIGLGLRKDLAPATEILAHLKPLLYDLNIQVCQQAAIAIGRLKTDAGAEVLFQMLQGENTPIPLQITLIQALAWMETFTSLNYLQQGISHLNQEASRELIRILGRITQPKLKTQASQILLDYYYSDREKTSMIKKTLAYSWGQLKATEAKEALNQLAQDQDISVKLHAQATLKQLVSN